MIKPLTDEDITDLFFPRGTENKMPKYVERWIQAGKIAERASRLNVMRQMRDLMRNNQIFAISDRDYQTKCDKLLIDLEAELAELEKEGNSG